MPCVDLTHPRLRRFFLITSAVVAAACSSGCGSASNTPNVASVAVSPSITSVVIGGTTQLTGTPKDATGNPVTGQTVTWSTGNASVASVSNTGLVTGVAAGGPVTITATSDGINGTASITVTPVPVALVSVSPATPVVALGATTELTATTRDANGNVLVGRTVTWMSSNPAIASVSASGLVTGVALGGPVFITAISEGANGQVSVTVSQPSFNAAWHLRRQITVTPGVADAGADVPAAYSVPLQFDHAALVTAGKALASGNDVRIAYWTGSNWVELDRVLDAGSAWNSATTTIWFKKPAAIPASGTDNNYYVYYSNAAADAPPSSSANVFLFADDFESGNLSKWTQVPAALWAANNTHTHSGAFAVMYPAEGPGSHLLLTNPALNVENVYLDT